MFLFPEVIGSFVYLNLQDFLDNKEYDELVLFQPPPAHETWLY